MSLPGFPSHSALVHSGASGAVPHLQLSRRDDLTGLASTGSRGRDPSVPVGPHRQSVSHDRV